MINLTNFRYAGILLLTTSLTDNKALLAGDSSKIWNITSVIPSNTLCTADGVVMIDNTYTFNVDGTFRFDHGNITEDASCDECCSDFVNLTGTWVFANGGKDLKIIALHQTENVNNAETVVLFDATIDRLEEGVMVISRIDQSTSIKHVFEFRAK